MVMRATVLLSADVVADHLPARQINPSAKTESPLVEQNHYATITIATRSIWPSHTVICSQINTKDNEFILKPLQFICNSIRESMGHPATLLRLLDEHPGLRIQLAEPKLNIAAYSVVQWHEWGYTSERNWQHRKCGTISGWRYSSDEYRSFDIHRPELEHFGRCEVDENWTCDIQSVVGFSTSKSKLEDFTNLNDMVEANSREMIDALTEEKLLWNLAHDEIRILHREHTSDHFAHHLWDGRVFLINNGGSHHFAAARYIAARIGRLVPLRGVLRTYSIDPMAANGLLRDFDMFVMSSEAAVLNSFHDAMQTFQATYLWQPLPRPCEQARVILLPKQEMRSAKVSTVLRASGLFDFGKYLTSLIKQQGAI